MKFVAASTPFHNLKSHIKMIIGKFLEKFTVSTALIAFIAIASTGCAGNRGLTEDKSYLTPIPQATFNAFQPGQPVETRLQAVIAAQQAIHFRMEWIGLPAVIFVETMKYEYARQRVEQLGSTSYYDQTPVDTQVWLVVFEGEWTTTTPLGTITAPSTGCVYTVLNAKDGSGMRAGGNSCENLKLDR